MAIDRTTMRQIISNVFDEMLEMPTTDIDPITKDSEQPRIVASIRISGAVEELIVVEASQAAAQLIAETMFDADPGSLDAEEVSDAVGEVVNMIGGNVKGIYDSDSQLSIPCVSEETEPLTEESEAGERTFVSVGNCPVLVRWRDMSPSCV